MFVSKREKNILGNMDFDYVFKLVIIGDSGVGKTSLLLRYTQKKFYGDHITTIGVDFKIKEATINNKRLKLQLWDTAGQERFAHITKQYFRGAHGIACVFALNDTNSWQNIPKWIQQSMGFEIESVILIGNKCDLTEERKIQKKDILAYIEQLDIDITYIETSASTGESVTDAFDNLARRLLERAEEAKDITMDNGYKDAFQIGSSKEIGKEDDEQIKLQAEPKKCC